MRYVILLLGATLLLAVATIGLLAYAGKTVPDVLEMIAVGALTGLAGVLARRPDEQGGGEHRAELES